MALKPTSQMFSSPFRFDPAWGASESARNFSIQPLYRKTEMNTTTTPILPPELATEARHLLTTARDHIAQALADDLTAPLRATEAGTSKPSEFPEGE